MEFQWVYLIPLILGPASFMMITLIVMVVAKTKQKNAEAHAAVQAKLIDKFGTAPELITFLKSDEGRKFLGDIEAAPKMNARDRIIRGMGKALITGFLGFGFLVIGFLPVTSNEFSVVVGFLLLTLGAGFFFSALLSLKLSRSWGLMEPDSPQTNV